MSDVPAALRTAHWRPERFLVRVNATGRTTVRVSVHAADDAWVSRGRIGQFYGTRSFWNELACAMRLAGALIREEEHAPNPQRPNRSHHLSRHTDPRPSREERMARAAQAEAREQEREREAARRAEQIALRRQLGLPPLGQLSSEDPDGD
ncbi:MAG TPA: hypothetical protein VFS08_04710 [Gemmatimonadaceae bacterium]|nr:hypothetical protein [Gemmatimonadaceae bacterium]